MFSPQDYCGSVDPRYLGIAVADIIVEPLPPRAVLNLLMPRKMASKLVGDNAGSDFEVPRVDRGRQGPRNDTSLVGMLMMMGCARPDVLPTRDRDLGDDQQSLILFTQDDLVHATEAREVNMPSNTAATWSQKPLTTNRRSVLA